MENPFYQSSIPPTKDPGYNTRQRTLYSLTLALELDIQDILLGSWDKMLSMMPKSDKTEQTID